MAIMASLVTAFDNGSLATDVYVAFEKFLHVPISLGYRFMFLLTTQALSFGIAGLFHKFLVEPEACVWPGVLPTCSMLYTMHQRNKQNEETNGWKISRMKLFAVVILCGTLYQFLPGFLFTGLTTFAWITWIFPNNVTINQVFGAISGMDLLPMTLDWNQVTGYLGSPSPCAYMGTDERVLRKYLFPLGRVSGITLEQCLGGNVHAVFFIEDVR